MENPKPIEPVSFSPEQARKELEDIRAAKEHDKIVRERMCLAVGCEEMTRIVNDILVPEFLSLTHAMRKAGHRAEVVAFDAENPVYPGEMCDIGMKFRCGDRDSPCKIEFVAEPTEFLFNSTIRVPNGDETTEVWSFASVIPRNLRKLILNFIDTHFQGIRYKPRFNDFDQHDDYLTSPFKIEIEEKGERSELASTDTMKEAIKMGASFSNMFKGKHLYIVDGSGNIVC